MTQGIICLLRDNEQTAIKLRYKEIGAHIKEFWTHVPGCNGLLAEILGIPYTKKRAMVNDVPKFDEP